MIFVYRKKLQSSDNQKSSKKFILALTTIYWQQYSRKIIIHQSVHCNAIMIGNVAFANDQDSTWF